MQHIRTLLLTLTAYCYFSANAQTDTSVVALTLPNADSMLRIINLNPFFTLHVDSTLSYVLQINRDPAGYFWYLRNAPVGLRIGKDNGTLQFRADKAYFLSGRLKYDQNYRVTVGVQSLANPAERIDTTFNLQFFSTEIIPSRVKPTVNATVWLNEGDTLSFPVECETGSFPIENILTLTNANLKAYHPVHRCGEVFQWAPGYDLVSPTDSAGTRSFILTFVGSTRTQGRDTAQVRVWLRDALNYPLAVEEHNMVHTSVQRYILHLKYAFLQLDKRLRRTKNGRTTFDLVSATTSVTGTVMATSSSESTKRNGKILPSVGLAMVPIKEATVPNKSVEQNQAALIRSSIKRLEYMLTDNTLIGAHDPGISKKTTKLRDELKQVQIQLIDVPVDFATALSEEELDRYFNSPKVNKKYRLKR